MAGVTSVSSAASSCRDRLHALTLANPFRNDALREGQRATWPDELLARFDHLASDFGLFDPGRFAIDHRLAKNQPVRAMALQYLQAISANADIARQNLTNVNELIAKDENPPGSRDPELHHSKPPILLAENQAIRARVDENITRLLRLSEQIRRHRKTKTDAKAAIYEPRDAKDQRLADEYNSHLNWRLDLSRQKMPDSFLKRRMRDTMMIRWRRTSYYSSPKSPSPPEAAAIDLAKESVLDNHHDGHPASDTDRKATVGHAVRGTARVGGPISIGPRSTGYTVSTSFRPNEQQGSIAPSSNAESLEGIQEDEFPEPPVSSSESGGFTCPYCGDLLPQFMREQESWRHHLLKDLSPYVCLFESCKTPLCTYSTSKQWLAHMNEMCQERDWVCQHCQAKFESEKTYRKHLTDVCFMSAEQIAFLLQLNAGSADSALFQSCLFCEKKSFPDGLDSHMAQHLREYALLSLPWSGSISVEFKHESKNAVSHPMLDAANSSIIRMDEYMAEQSEFSDSDFSDTMEIEHSKSKADIDSSDYNAQFNGFLASAEVSEEYRHNAVLSLQRAVTTGQAPDQEPWPSDTAREILDYDDGLVPVATDRQDGDPSLIDQAENTRSTLTPADLTFDQPAKSLDPHLTGLMIDNDHAARTLGHAKDGAFSRSRIHGPPLEHPATTLSLSTSARKSQGVTSPVKPPAYAGGSGIEVAGIIFAVLGTLIQGVGGYNEVVTGRDVNLLVESLKDNKIMFENSVEYLLRSILPTGELVLLFDDPRGEQWQDRDFHERVIAHLGQDAEDILRKIKDIYNTVSQLQKKLPAQRDDATVVARALHVIKCFVRGPPYSASLERLNTRISEFRTLVDDALKLAPSRGVSSRALQDLILVQECANWLHDALKVGWKCSCEESHPVSIRLDVWSPRTTADHENDTVCVNFSLLFADDAQQARQNHWMTAEITTSRTSFNRAPSLLTSRMSGSIAPTVTSVTPLLVQSGSNSISPPKMSATTRVDQGSAQNTSDDLCPITKSPTESSPTSRRRVGSISDGEGHNFNLFIRPGDATTKSSTTLAEVYRKQSRLSRKNRVQLALTLAWSVLQISSTSWLRGKWTKDNIVLVTDTTAKPLPYLCHRFESSRRDSKLSTLSPATRDQVSDWVNNTSLFALGVFLLEMCYDCPIEDLATSQEKNENGEASDYTPILTAMRLSKLAQDELGVCYAQAIKACLEFPKIDMDTNGKPADLSRFATIIMRDIISPLEKVAELFGK